MCGEFGPSGRDSDGQFILLELETVRARKQYQCIACLGTIASGAYYCRAPFIGDSGRDHFKFHLQCRDLANNINWYGPEVVVDLREYREDGREWLAHYTAVAEWATGLPYRRSE